jgi:WD40 repeat protein
MSGTGLFASYADLKLGIETFAFSANGKMVAASSHSQDRSIDVWDLGAHAKSVPNGHKNFISHMAFSSKGDYLASYDGLSLRIWDLAGTTPYLAGVPISLDSSYKLVAEAGKVLSNVYAARSDKARTSFFIWDGSNASVKEYKGHNAAISDVAISHDGRVVASLDQSNNLMIWNAQADIKAQLIAHQGRLALSPDGAYLALLSDEMTLSIWPVDKMNSPSHAALKMNASPWDHGICKELSVLAFSNSGELGFRCDSNVVVMSNFGKSGSRVIESGEKWTRVKLSRDGRFIAYTSGDRSVGLRDLWTNSVKTLEHDSGVKDMAFSDDGYTIAVLTARGVCAWNVFTGEGDIVDGKTNGDHIGFLGDGRFLGVFSDQIVHHWHNDFTHSPEELRSLLNELTFEP